MEKINGVFLDALERVSCVQGWGRLQENQSVWEKPMTIAGRRFRRGKVILILGFVGLAAGRLGAVHIPPPQSAPLALMGVSLVWVSFSYSGWNAAIYVGSEVTHPERNLPRSLLLGTAIVTLAYLALNAVFVFSAPIDQLAGKLEVGRVAATALGGPARGNMVSALVAHGIG